MSTTADRTQADQIFELTIGEVETLTANFTALLYDDTLTGTPTVTWVDSLNGGMTKGTPAVNASAVDPDGRKQIAIGKAVQVEINATAATAGTYSVKVLCGTTNGRTKGLTVTILVRA